MKLFRRTVPDYNIIPRSQQNAIVPEYARQRLLTRIIPIIKIIAVIAGLFVFYVLQAGIGLMTSKVSNPFLLALALTGTAAIVVFLGGDVRFRFLLFVAFFVIMSGQLGYFFSGNTKLSTFVLEQILSAAFIVWLTLDVLANRMKAGKLIPVATPFILYALAIIISFALQDSVSDPRSMRFYILQGLLGVCFMVGAYVYFDQWSKVGKALNLLILGGVMYAVLGWIEYIFPGAYYSVYQTIYPERINLVDRALYFKRIIGPFTNGPTFAVWLSLFAPLILYCILHAKTNARKVFMIGIMLVLLGAMFFTGSRAPFLAVCLGFIIYPWILGNARVAIGGTVALVVAVILFLAVGPRLAKVLPENNLFERTFSPQGGQTATLDIRKDVWRDAYTRWQESKWVGIGLGEFIVERTREVRRDSYKKLQSAHSGYISTLVELGVIGVVTTLGIMYATFVFGYRAVMATPQGARRGLAAAFFTSCCVLYLGSFTEPGFTLNRNWFMYTLLLGFLMKMPIIAHQEATLTEEQIAENRVIKRRSGRRTSPAASPSFTRAASSRPE